MFLFEGKQIRRTFIFRYHVLVVPRAPEKVFSRSDSRSNSVHTGIGSLHSNVKLLYSLSVVLCRPRRRSRPHRLRPLLWLFYRLLLLFLWCFLQGKIIQDTHSCMRSTVGNWPFVGCGHMVQNTPYWNAKECVRLQNKTQLTKKVWFSLFVYPSGAFAFQYGVFRTMWRLTAKGLF